MHPHRSDPSTLQLRRAVLDGFAQVHFKHQKEIQRFHDRREDKLREIEKKKQLYALSYREEFTVDDDIVGLVRALLPAWTAKKQNKLKVTGPSKGRRPLMSIPASSFLAHTVVLIRAILGFGTQRGCRR